MKKSQGVHEQVTETLKVVSELTANFKTDYLFMVEKWLEFDYQSKIDFVHDYDLNAKYFDKYGNPVKELPEGLCIWDLRLLARKYNAIPYEIHTCAYLSKYTPEEFNTRAFSSFGQIQERLLLNKSKWFAKEMKKTSKAFDNGLLKITNAIIGLQMDIDAIVVNDIKIENGIDITLTDGQKKCHIFTIIASGYIQRPHFRFLIKTKTL